MKSKFNLECLSYEAKRSLRHRPWAHRKAGFFADLYLAAGIAIGGDSFPGSTLSDHCLRYENIPQVKIIVVLGELGGTDEYSLVEALKAGKIKKPVVAWVSGTCAKLFKSEVQFGHAGAKSGGQAESAQVRGRPLPGSEHCAL